MLPEKLGPELQRHNNQRERDYMAENNSTIRKISPILITIIIFVVTIAIAWGSVLTTVQKIDLQVILLNEKKLDKEVYDECVRGIRRDILEIKAGQQRTNDKLDRILEKL